MSFCPNCGMENADTANECRRCHVPLEMQAETAPQAAAGADEFSNQLGVVCRRCESYNEPGTARCTTCGYKLIPDEEDEQAAAADTHVPPFVEASGSPAPGSEAALDHTPPSPVPAHVADRGAAE